MASEPVNGQAAARRWLQQRVDAQTAAAVQNLLRETAQVLSIASGDGVAIRVCSADGRFLLPLAAHHPDPTIQEAMWNAMVQTPIMVAGGLWAEVIGERRTIMYDLRSQLPANAMPVQTKFVQTHPVTFVLGAPVTLHHEIVGCVSLVRYVDERPFSDDEHLLLEDVARRAAAAIDFGHLADFTYDDAGKT